MASTVPAVKAALKNAIAARATIVTDKVLVTWSEPVDEADYQGTLEAIWMGDVEQTEEWPGLGPRRDEEYRIGVVIRVFQYGDDEQATETRAWALRDEVVQAVATDATLKSLLNLGAEVERTEQRNMPAEKAWLAELTLTVRCRTVNVQQ
jgi:hypothetical protein